MIKYFVIGLVIIVLIIIFSIVKNIHIKKRIDKFLSSFKSYELIKVKNKLYDYVLRYENKDLYLRILVIPRNSQITINSKETWCLRWNTFKQDKGKAYNNKRYLDEIEGYLKKNIVSNRPSLKLIFIYKGVDSIVRYLNETELDTIDITKSPYNYKITSYESFEKDIDYIEKQVF